MSEYIFVANIFEYSNIRIYSSHSVLKAKQLAEFTFQVKKLAENVCKLWQQNVATNVWKSWKFNDVCDKIAHFLRKYDICKCLLKNLAMIEHDQEKTGCAVSGQSKNLMGFAFWT